MYAVMLRVGVEAGRMDESIEFVERNVLPMVRQTPGIVAGYWLAQPDGVEGVALTIFESEEAAKASIDEMDSAPRPDYASFLGVQLLRVTASL